MVTIVSLEMDEVWIMKDDDSIMDEVDVEEYGKAGKRPPNAKVYRVRIDKEKYSVPQQLITGRGLLELTPLRPIEKYRIHQKLHGGQMVEIGYDETVDLGQPGIERFTTIELAVGDGE